MNLWPSSVLIDVEYILQNLVIIPCKVLKIFSDSQSTNGILTLNWKDTRYGDVTKDIRKIINRLQQKGIAVEIDWIPGHSALAGNEAADQLAREATLEASTFAEDKRNTSHMEIKLASQKFIMLQWQRRLELYQKNYWSFQLLSKVKAKRLFEPTMM